MLRLQATDSPAWPKVIAWRVAGADIWPDPKGVSLLQIVHKDCYVSIAKPELALRNDAIVALLWSGSVDVAMTDLYFETSTPLGLALARLAMVIYRPDAVAVVAQG